MNRTYLLILSLTLGLQSFATNRLLAAPKPQSIPPSLPASVPQIKLLTLSESPKSCQSVLLPHGTWPDSAPVIADLLSLIKSHSRPHIHGDHQPHSSDWESQSLTDVLHLKKLELARRYGTAFSQYVFEEIHKQLLKTDTSFEETTSAPLKTEAPHSSLALFDFEPHMDFRIPSLKAGISMASLSSDGQWLIAAGMDDSAYLWSLGDGRRLQTFQGHALFLNSAVFSPDSSRVLTSSIDTTAIIWDAQSGAKLRVLAKAHRAGVNSAVFSHNGHLIATAAADNSFALWDASSGKRLLLNWDHSNSVYSAVFSADDRWLLTASRDGSAVLWDVATGELEQRFDHQGASVTSALFSSDDKTIFTLADKREVVVWALGQKEPLMRLHTGKNAAVTAMAISHHGSLLALGTENGRIQLWDPVSGRLFTEFTGSEGAIVSLEFSLDDAKLLLATSSKEVLMWSLHPPPFPPQLSEKAQ